MADEMKNPFEGVQAMMLENLERVQEATQRYIDMVEKAVRAIPGADEKRVTTFKAYLERQAAANHDFAEGFCVPRISMKPSAFRLNTFNLN
jgi:hypothetical protein